MAWVVIEIDPFIVNTTGSDGWVSLHDGYSNSSVPTTICDAPPVEPPEPPVAVEPALRTILWTIHPQRRMQANINIRNQRRAVAGYRLNQDFRPWRQQRYYHVRE